MVDNTGSSIPPKPEHREECYTCRRVKAHCLCAIIKPFATRLRFVILMHDDEAKLQRTGTGRLAKLCLKNAELIVGTDFTRNAQVNALLKNPSCQPFLLYPGPKAVNFQTLDKAALPPGRTPLIFVIDGTWRSSRSILYKSPNISALPRLSLAGSYVSQFKFKKQPKAHCVSTIEAIYYLCREAEAAGREDCRAQKEVLLTVFNKMVETQLRFSRELHRRREENPKKNASAA
jgi:DTW domain-containing protein YfiP